MGWGWVGLGWVTVNFDSHPLVNYRPGDVALWRHKNLRELGKETLDKLQISNEDITYPSNLPFASGTFSEVMYYCGLLCRELRQFLTGHV